MDVAKAIRTHLWKPFEKQPGWVYLVVAVYLGIRALSLGGTLGLSAEIWAAVLTPMLYLVGDFLDGLLFRRRDGTERVTLPGLNDARKRARDAFEIQDGAYDVSLKLLGKAGQPLQRASVHFQNELSKFLRSLVLPLISVGLYLGVTRSGVFIPLTAIGLVVVWPYLVLKLRHMRSLYGLAPTLCRSPKYRWSNLTMGPDKECIRLFFWGGSLLESALFVPDADKRTGTAVLVPK